MKALIFGNGASGKSAANLMKKLGFDTFVIDDKRKKITPSLEEKLLKNLDKFILSPGVPYNTALANRARLNGTEVIGEFEMGTRMLSCPSVAVTGTNGKTTTVTLLGSLLEDSFDRVFVGGNIGVPVSSFCMETKKEDIAALEVSSFQLESSTEFHPHVAAILNITPDHLNRHKSMENYTRIKFKIFENQTKNDFAILNLDDPALVECDTSFIRSEIFYFSTKMCCRGCYCKDGSIYFNDGMNDRYIMSVRDIPLSGQHNVSNVLAALLLAILAGAKVELLPQKVKAFKGVSHRLEYVAEVGRVTFINDSKATNISSTIVAVSAMNEPTTLILGGSDKGFDFDELFLNMPSIIKNFVVIGETKNKILESAKKFNISNVFEAKNFKEGVYLAYELSGPDETVLLSPAAASFDMFRNFEERGRVFIKIVREIEKIENRKVRGKKS